MDETVNKRSKGFTFIELLIALMVVAICFLPLMEMFSTVLEQVQNTKSLATARVLGQEGMEKIKNLNFTKEELKSIGNIWQPPLDKPALVLNGNKWRILTKIIQETDPLEVRIQVYQLNRLQPTAYRKPIVELVTLIEDLEWAIIPE